MAKEITTLLLDWGGVLVDIDESGTIKAFEALGGKVNHDIIMPWELGECSEEEHIANLKEYLPRWVSVPTIIKTWNDMIVGFPEERLRWLRRKSKDYKLILVSNTNAWHVEAIKEKMGPFIWKQFNDCFEDLVFSHEVHNRKPNASFYEGVMKKHKLTPEECFFVDDNEDNIAAAQELGITSYWFRPEEETILDLDITR